MNVLLVATSVMTMPHAQILMEVTCAHATRHFLVMAEIAVVRMLCYFLFHFSIKILLGFSLKIILSEQTTKLSLSTTG